MSQSSKKILVNPSTNLEKWEMLKANAMSVHTIELHGAGRIFTKTEKTINDIKFKGIKMWRAPNCYLLEMGGKTQILELPGVYCAIPE